MSNAIEIEAKALVNKEEYGRLVKRFKEYPSFSQTNYYIDTEKSDLRVDGLGLRIREKDNSYEMTLKAPLSQGLLEKTAHLSKEEFNNFVKKGIFPENDLKRFLTMLDIDVNELHILASLRTERTDIPYLGGKLSLDKNEYNGLTDYEIELEFNNEADAEKLLKELFDEEGIHFEINKRPKSIRALDSRK